MGVLKAGQHQPADEVDHLGARPDVLVEVLLRSHRDHAPGGDHQAVPRAMGAAVEDVAVAEDVGGRHTALSLRNQWLRHPTTPDWVQLLGSQRRIRLPERW